MIQNQLISAEEFQSRLKKIKLLLLDVDGILTDARTFYIEGTGFVRVFNMYDGYGIKLLLRAGFPVGIISGGKAKDLQERIKILGIEHAVLGSEDKLQSAKIISEKLNIPFENIAFMGDELFDLPALRAVGLSITVPGAVQDVKNEVNWITQKQGGDGAVREIIDAIRKAQNLPA
jgi:3-deoxy-D-manno-octulosonate 8-phosphate phosphatase (KDO 8-P phosphatase)